jgi:hypothetical protein
MYSRIGGSGGPAFFRAGRLRGRVAGCRRGGQLQAEHELDHGGAPSRSSSAMKRAPGTGLNRYGAMSRKPSRS